MPSAALQIRITPDDRLALAQAVTSFFSLITYDQAWTGLLVERRDDEAFEPQLMLVLSQLLRDLHAGRAGATWLQQFVLDNGAGPIVEAVVQVRANTDDEDLRRAVGDLVDLYGGQLGELTEAGYAGLVSNEIPQFDALLEEARGALRHQASEGDLLKNVLCSAATLMISGGMVSTLIPPHVQGPVIAGVGVSVFGIWKCKLDELERKAGWKPAR
jgi:hypothetical protein